MASPASSALRKARQALPLGRISEILGLVPQVSSKCFSSFFHVVSFDKPLTQTFLSASILSSLSIYLFDFTWPPPPCAFIWPPLGTHIHWPPPPPPEPFPPAFPPLFAGCAM